MASQLQHFGRGALRVAKNYTKGYTDTQTKIRDATSNDPWGPSGTQMNEIAQLTYNQNDFVEVMEMLDKRLNDKGKNWRHVFKALTVLDYILHAGSENVVIYFRDNIYIVKTLKEFVYASEDGKDVGANVRQKAKDITNLLADEDRLRAERRSRGAMRDRMLGNIADSGLQGESDYGGPRSPPPQRDHQPPAGRPPNRSRDSDDELKRAIEESKRMMDDEASRRSRVTQEEDDLRRALRESEEDESKRKREQDDSNARALMDDSFNLQSNNQYSQQQQPDLFGQQMWGQQQQLQPQFTSYNPFQMMQMQQAEQQRQQEEFLRQQQMYQQQQQQQQQEEYMRQQYLQQQQQQQALMAQPTGYRSNNPFAPSSSFLSAQNNPGAGSPSHTGGAGIFGSSPGQGSSFLPVPQVSSPAGGSNGLPSPMAEQPAPAFKPAQQPKRDDGQHAGLAGLLARGREDGLDTFGNQGNLRIPQGSVFHTSNRMGYQPTGAAGGAGGGSGLGGNNPFGRPQGQQGQGQGQSQGQGQDQPFFSV